MIGYAQLVYSLVYFILYIILLNILPDRPYMGIFPFAEWTDIHTYALNFTGTTTNILLIMQCLTFFYPIVMLFLFIAMGLYGNVYILLAIVYHKREKALLKSQQQKEVIRKA